MKQQYDHINWIARVCLSFSLTLALLLGAVAPCRAAETVFPGGKLADLRALSSNLTFDKLTITGPLDLGLYGDTILQVNELLITATGGVGYSKPACSHYAAPHFTVVATGQVVVHGSITLNGEYGSRVLDTATCNSCTGYDGGDVDITAADITMAGSITNHGGGASVTTDGSCSSGCSGGGGGKVSLKAGNIHLNSFQLETGKGSGGSGYCYGKQTHGPDGQPGTVALVAADLLEMEQSAITIDGKLAVQAARADIKGPITYGSIEEIIGSGADTTAPELEILSPLAESKLDIASTLEIRVRAHDNGTGVRQVRVTGMGHDQIHPASELVDGILTVTIPKIVPSATIVVTAWDNKDNITQSTVAGLQVLGDWIVKTGESCTLDHDLDFGTAAVTIAGKVFVKKGISVSMRAGTLTIPAGGAILHEAAAATGTATTALTISLSGAAVIDGSIDLRGPSGSSGGSANGEQGGTISLRAASITIAGSLLADGGDAYWKTNYCNYSGSAGDITLIAGGSAVLHGTLSAKGGNGVCDYWGLGTMVAAGGTGGDISLYYGDTADTTGLKVDVTGGRGASQNGHSTPATVNGTWNQYNKSAAPPLTITATAGAGGTIEPSGSTSVPWGESSPVYAITPAPHYHVAEVTVDGIAKGPLFSYQECIVDRKHTIVATFAKNPGPALVVTRTGDGTGTVMSEPEGLDCGTVCEQHFGEEAQVELIASATSGSAFLGWSGGGCTGKESCTVTMNVARTVTAHFALLPPAAAFPAIAVTPAAATFGQSSIGNGYLRTLAVCNKGSDNLAIAAVTLAGDTSQEFIVTEDFCSGRILTPTPGCETGQTPPLSGICTFTLLFTPTEAGDKRAAARIASTDPGTPVKSLAVTAKTMASSPLAAWRTGSPVTTNLLNALAFGNGTFVAAGSSGTLLTSSDGTSWTPRGPFDANFSAVTFGNGTFVVLGGNTIATSNNGESWNSQVNNALIPKRVAAFGNGIFVNLGLAGAIYTSTNGETWIQRRVATLWGANLNNVTYGNGTFVAVGDKGTILTSPDGTGWTARVSGVSGKLLGLSFGSGTFVASGQDGLVLTSPDGVAWTGRLSGTSEYLNAVTFSQCIFVAVGGKGSILTSPDGVAWTPRYLEAGTEFYDVAAGNDTILALGNRYDAAGTLLGGVVSSADAPLPPTIAITKLGSVAGTVMSTPAGIDCGATCAADFPFEASVTLTATPAEGRSTFLGWIGGGCAGTGPCTVTADSAKNIVATFVNWHTVGATASPGGSLAPAGSQTVRQGTKATYRVNPEQGYQIAAVTGCDGTLQDDTYTTGPVLADCTVRATFEVLPTVTVAATISTAAEAGAVPGQFTVTRTGGTASPLPVQFTLSGRAVVGSDYADPGVTVTIPAGSASATVAVTPLDDRGAEPREAVILTLSDDAHYLVGNPASAFVTITSDDPFSDASLQLSDTDRDGMPDTWELAHGFNPLVNDALTDRDGDGISNMDEYLAALDPDRQDAVLSGRVTDGAGNPLADVWVEALGPKGQQGGGAATDEDGRYRIAVPRADGYRVVIRQTGPYTTTFFDNATTWREARVIDARGGLVRDLDFILTMGDFIAGTITGLPAAESAVATAWSETTGSFALETITGTGGAVAYTLQGLTPAADYRIELMAEGLGDGYIQSGGGLGPWATAALFATGAGNADATLVTGHAITGSITGLEPGSMAWVTASSEKTGISGTIAVTADNSPAPYTITGLPNAQDYLVTIWAPGYSAGAWKGTSHVAAAPVTYEDGESVALNGADVAGIDFILAEGYQISGKVRGLSVGERAFIDAWSESTGLWRGTVILGTGMGSDPYTITGLPAAADYVVRIDAEGYLGGFHGQTGLASSADEAVLVDATANPVGIDFILSQGSTIGGVIVGLAAGEQGWVSAWSETAGSWGTALVMGSGGDVEYVITGLARAKDFVVRCTVAGHPGLAHEAIDSSWDPGNVHFLVQTGLTLSGTIRKAGPHEQVLVSVWSTTLDQHQTTMVMTDGNGAAAYAITGLAPADDYIVSASSVAGKILFYDGARQPRNATPLKVASNCGGVDFDFSLVATRTLSGEIAGLPSDALVAIDAWDDATGLWAGIERHGDGAFELFLPGGAYKIAVRPYDSAEVYWQAVLGGLATMTYQLDLAAEVNLAPGNFNLGTMTIAAGYRLSGRICVDRNNSGGCEPGEELGGVSVEAVSSSLATSTITAGNGRYSLRGLPAGDYTLRVTSLQGGMETTIPVTADRVKDLVITTNGHGGITGTVTTSTGTPVANAMVLLFDNNHVFVNAVLTGQDGTFTYSGLNAGDYTINVDATGDGLPEQTGVRTSVLAGSNTPMTIMVP